MKAHQIVKDKDHNYWYIIKDKQGELCRVPLQHKATDVRECIEPLDSMTDEDVDMECAMTIHNGVFGEFIDCMLGITRLVEAERQLSGLTFNELGAKYYIHLIEEIGEITKCYRGKGTEPLQNEFVDAAICALAGMFAESMDKGSFADLVKIINQKMEKWVYNIDKLMETEEETHNEQDTVSGEDSKSAE